jgi:hypothetical protein
MHQRHHLFATLKLHLHIFLLPSKCQCYALTRTKYHHLPQYIPLDQPGYRLKYNIQPNDREFLNRRSVRQIICPQIIKVPHFIDPRDDRHTLYSSCQRDHRSASHQGPFQTYVNKSLNISASETQNFLLDLAGGLCEFPLGSAKHGIGLVHCVDSVLYIAKSSHYPPDYLAQTFFGSIVCNLVLNSLAVEPSIQAEETLCNELVLTSTTSIQTTSTVPPSCWTTGCVE